MNSSAVYDRLVVSESAPRAYGTPPGFPDPSVLPARDALPFAQYAAPFLPFLEYHGLGTGFLRDRYAKAVVAALCRPGEPLAIVAEALPAPAAVSNHVDGLTSRPTSLPELVLRPSSHARASVTRRALYLLALRAPALAFSGAACAVSFAPDPALVEALVAAGFRNVPTASSFRVMVPPGSPRT